MRTSSSLYFKFIAKLDFNHWNCRCLYLLYLKHLKTLHRFLGFRSCLYFCVQIQEHMKMASQFSFQFLLNAFKVTNTFVLVSKRFQFEMSSKMQTFLRYFDTFTRFKSLRSTKTQMPVFFIRSSNIKKNCLQVYLKTYIFFSVITDRGLNKKKKIQNLNKNKNIFTFVSKNSTKLFFFFNSPVHSFRFHVPKPHLQTGREILPGQLQHRHIPAPIQMQTVHNRHRRYR